MMRIKPLKDCRIHVWGGLGSQLFGISLALDLLDHFPKKQYTIIFHSSGVTRRSLDFELEQAPFKTSYVDDYKESNTVNNLSFTPKSLINPLVKNLLRTTGFLSEANDQLEFNNIKNWTSTYRGHYSYRQITTINTCKMIELLESNKLYFYSTNVGLEKIVSVHYRLGDLVALKRSSLVDPARLKSLMKSLSEQKVRPEFYLFSDNVQMAYSLLRDKKSSFNLMTLELDAWNTLAKLSFSRVFIGTNSKISIWAAIFRSRLNIGDLTYLPIELKGQVQRNLDSYPRIMFY